ncbi:MAG TPA: M56 family metallopeptidase [Prosthecobacter sp.]
MNATFLDHASHWLLRASGEASVLVLAVLALRAALGIRLSPAWRVALWMLVVAKLVLPACIPTGFGLGGWSFTGLQKSQAAVAEQTAVSLTAEAAVPAAANALASHAFQAGQMLPASTVPAQGRPAFTRRGLLVAAWLSGALLLLAVAGIRQGRFARWVRQRPVATDPALLEQVVQLRKLAGVSRNIQVRLMPAGTTPAIMGVFRPVLLLAENWREHFDQTRLRHVLLHEILHVRHHDLVWNWVVLALQALHWFNPLVWMAGARFQADRELRCDAAVLRLLAPQERLDYGRTLLHVQETFFAPPAIPGLAPCVRNHPALLQRITMIAQPNRTRPWLQTVFALAFGVITCYAFTTARAADEKDIPSKDRSRESERGPRTTEESANPQRGREGERGKEGEGDGRMNGEKDKLEDGKKPARGDREGGAKTGPRDGEGERKGPRDGERPRTGERDGERKQTGERDGDRPRTGERDGERKKAGERDGERARTGERDGDRKRTGERDGDRKQTGARDGERPSTGERDGEGRASREGAGAGAEKGVEHKVTNKKRSNLNASATGQGLSAGTIAIRLIKQGEAVRVGDEEMPIGKLRGHLHHQETGNDTPYRLSAEPDVPYKGLTDALDALKDNGKWNVEVVRE